MGNITYFLAVCDTCRQPLLYYVDESSEFANPDYTEFEIARLIWPTTKLLSEAVPLPVRRCYSEAARVRQKSPKSFAIHIRSALEALCDERGAAKGTLSKRLKDLAFKGEIPGALARMSEVIRVLGNIGAHDYNSRISHGDVSVIDDFFQAIVEYVYVGPDKIMNFQQRLSEFGKVPQATTDPAAEDGAATAITSKPETSNRVN